jgi:LysM repeat protein
MAALADNAATTRQQYIAQWKDEAVYQMVVHKIPASITLAQGILESGDGNSRLAREGNNHFGIKCHNDWQGKTLHEDDETKGECFRKYDNARESFEDHSAFLQRKRYETLFALPVDDYKGWCKGLKQCGYATNPKYPELLLKIIDEFALHQYDEIGKQYIKDKKIPARSGGKDTAPVATNNAAKPKGKGKHGGNKNADDDRTTITISNNREIALSANRIKYTVVKEGETLKAIAEALDMNEGQLKRYNDLSTNAQLKAGQILYTQPKRNKAKQATCTVKKGDSLWSISQEFGVKMSRIKTYNTLEEGAMLKAGQELKLRK